MALFSFGMKAKDHMDIMADLPHDAVPSNVYRRYDIGCNQQSSEIPLFSLAKWSQGNVSQPYLFNKKCGAIQTLVNCPKPQKALSAHL